MTPEQVIQTIEVYLATELAGLQILYLSEEEVLNGPLPDAALSWVRSQIEMGPVEEVELGRFGVSIRTGVLKLFVRTGPTQVRLAAQIAGQCEPLLRRKAVNGVEFAEPETKRPKDPLAQQEILLVQCPFQVYP